MTTLKFLRETVLTTDTHPNGTHAPAGTVLEMDDDRALVYIRTGAARVHVPPPAPAPKSRPSR